MTLGQARSGQTSYLKYDLDKKTVTLHEFLGEEISLGTAKRLRNDIDNVLKMAQPLAPASAPDDLSLSTPPWIFRKLFGWQNVIKKA